MISLGDNHIIHIDGIVETNFLPFIIIDYHHIFAGNRGKWRNYFAAVRDVDGVGAYHIYLADSIICQHPLVARFKLISIGLLIEYPKIALVLMKVKHRSASEIIKNEQTLPGHKYYVLSGNNHHSGSERCHDIYKVTTTKVQP